MSADEDRTPIRIPTDAAVVIREDFKPDPVAARECVKETKELLHKMKFGPKCSAGDDCENKIFLEEYEKIDRDYERELVRELAAARVRINELEKKIAEYRDPYEKRDDDKKVRKDRWEYGIRSIVGILHGPRYSFEVEDIVEEVRKLHAQRADK